MNYGIKDAANIFIKTKGTSTTDGKIFLYTPYANVTTNEWSAERVYAMAKGVRAIAWDHGKESSLTVEAEVFELKWLAMMAGSDWIDASVDNAFSILRRESLIADETGKVSLSATPIESSVSVFELDTDGVSHKSEIESPTIAGKDVTLLAMANKKVAVYYMESITTGAKKLEFKFDKYPANFEVYGDVMIAPKTGAEPEFVQMHWANAKPQNNFTIALDVNNPTNLSITFDIFPDENDNMATYTVI